MFVFAIQWAVTHLHRLVHNEKYGKPVLEVLVLVAAILVGAGLHRHYSTPDVPKPSTNVVQTTPDTTTHYIPQGTVTEKAVVSIVSDPKDRETINLLFKENKELNGKVVALTNTVAELKTTGGTDKGGVITPEPAVKEGETVQLWHYKDYQLAADYTPTTFNYGLNQKFQIVSSTAKQKDGRRVELVRLYQQGENGERIPVPAETQAIFADETAPHWFTGLRVHAGVGVTKSLTGTDQGAIIGAQWLKHGRTNAPEDIRFAVLTPALFLSTNVKEMGVMPFQFNIGSIKHQPLTNMWFSPYIGADIPGRSISRFGLFVTGQF